MVDCQHHCRGRDRGDRRRLRCHPDRHYVDRLDRIALCAAAEAFALARDQAMPELITGRYALALTLSSTRSDVQILLPRFPDETFEYEEAGRRKNYANQSRVYSQPRAVAEPTRRSRM
jgi:hypothetical protein